MFTGRPKRFAVNYCRAVHGRAWSTHAFRVLPNTVRRVQVMVLASCITFISRYQLSTL